MNYNMSYNNGFYEFNYNSLIKTFLHGFLFLVNFFSLKSYHVDTILIKLVSSYHSFLFSSTPKLWHRYMTSLDEIVPPGTTYPSS